MSEPARTGPVGGPPAEVSLAALGPLLDRLEELLAQVEEHDEPVRELVFELLDGVDAVHRLAVTRLADALAEHLGPLRGADPAVNWLFEAYGVGVDDLDAARAALDPVRPYLQEHGGEVEILQVQRGVVRLRLAGACSGCTSAAETLRDGIATALRENLPGFVAMDVVPNPAAAPHPPPTQALLQITPRPS